MGHIDLVDYYDLKSEGAMEGCDCCRRLKFAQRYLWREIDKPCGLGSSMFLALATLQMELAAL